MLAVLCNNYSLGPEQWIEADGGQEAVKLVSADHTGLRVGEHLVERICRVASEG